MKDNASMGLYEKKTCDQKNLRKDTGATKNYAPVATDEKLSTDRGKFTQRS